MTVDTPRPSPPTERLAAFRELVFRHYRDHGRDLPWRRTRDPYRILVSEVMLQQTQVERVLPKYEAFLERFPDLSALAVAPAGDVLEVWQGLGYNRRALALHRTAKIVDAEYAGVLPHMPDTLTRLPGIGPATAAALCAFAYDYPVPFIETNIRAAFLFFFFRECGAVSDADILPLVEATLDVDDPRHWYYALMDYGSWIKKNHPNPGRRSKHHVRQSAFAGSRRQLRAQIIRTLLAARQAGTGAVGLQGIAGQSPHWSPTQVKAVLEELSAEGFLMENEEGYRIA